MTRWRDSWPLLLLTGLAVAAYVDLKVELAEIRTVLEFTRGEPPRRVPSEPAVEPAAGPRPVDAGPVPDSWACEGTIAPDLVTVAVGRQGPAVFACYERRLRDEPDLSGLLIVEAKVGPRGAVEAVRVGGMLGDRPLASCVADAVQGWRFPPPVGGDCAIVSAPFHLEPDSPRGAQ